MRSSSIARSFASFGERSKWLSNASLIWKPIV